jgi:hypothetical protein
VLLGRVFSSFLLNFNSKRSPSRLSQEALTTDDRIPLAILMLLMLAAAADKEYIFREASFARVFILQCSAKNDNESREKNNKYYFQAGSSNV